MKPIKDLLAEWHAAEPSAEFDKRVVAAYQAEIGSRRAPSAWRRLLLARISVPVPVFLAAAAVVAVILWYRSAPAPRAVPDAPGILTQLNATGFQPLPDGAARVVSLKEAH